MEKQKKTHPETGRLRGSDREAVRKDERGCCSASHLSGGQISGICMVRLESDQRKPGNTQQTREQADRRAAAARDRVAEENDSGSELEEEE